MNSSMTNHMETMETLCLMAYKVRLSHTKKLFIPLLFCTGFFGRWGKEVQISRTKED